MANITFRQITEASRTMRYPFIIKIIEEETQCEPAPSSVTLTMATLEDRLLGEKTHYYCSSSEDEENDEDGHKIIDDSECAASYPSNGDWDGSSMNSQRKFYKNLNVIDGSSYSISLNSILLKSNL
ncbi:hypothetical protein Anas_10387 [Armadillidium nasatum]|uniref:Uncharacterized protein n=1 Tax=Armadillidium nasatum TaxID=96803 RepID=A0A5N5T8D9_9CRUS|nr:hypothetical protein Anas_10387 [Armadillidium nasatum]